MLSQRRRSLGIGYTSAAVEVPDYCTLATPPHKQGPLFDIRPPFQHHRFVRSPPRKYSQQHTTAVSEHGWPSTVYQHSSPQTAKKVGRTSNRQANAMKHFTTSSSPPPSVQFPFPASAEGSTTFTFATSHLPTMALSFPPRASVSRSLKRCRPLTDVDGECSYVRKKKRRLRLFLITSRLSLPYSQPATNIVDRGSSKIAVWAKQKALGRNLLRKAAILNRVRRQALLAKDTEDAGMGRILVEQEREQKQFELAKLAFLYGSHDTHTRPILQARPSFPPTVTARTNEESGSSGDHVGRVSSPDTSSPSTNNDAEEPTRPSPNDAYCYALPRAQIPRRTHLPLPPSPLGLSNYDAFDFEDDIPDPYAHLDEDEDDGEEKDESADPEVTDPDPRSPSTSTSASFGSTLSTAGTESGEALKTPPQLIYSDFSVLDPGEPVVGDYDGVDGLDDVDAVWPSCPIPPPKTEQDKAIGSFPTVSPPSTYCTSPNFALGLPTSKTMTINQKDISEEKERQKSFMFHGFNP